MSRTGWVLPVCLLLSMNITGVAAEIHKDIEYSRAEGMSLRLDASTPDGDGPFPAAILVHGGGWVRGDRRIDVAPLLPAREAARPAAQTIRTPCWLRSHLQTGPS